jgi:hypothetical protein
MQLYPGRSADQWRGFAALDPPGSEQPPAWHDSTRGHGACRHQHRSDNFRDADAEYISMRREHDDESVDARHDGPGQRNRGRGNAGRNARIAIGLLRALAQPPFSRPDIASRVLDSRRATAPSGPSILKPYLMVGLVFGAYVSWEAARRACPPGAGVQIGRKTDSAGYVLGPRIRLAGAVRLFNG